METPGVYRQIIEYLNELYKNDETLSNVVQGELWRKLYKLDDDNIIILPGFLYYDDMEPGNGLGSHAGEQKLGGFYISLPCLPPHLVAKMENIFISTLCYTKNLKQFGNEKLFSITIDELNDLSRNSITLNIDGRKQKVYFQCVTILGDNLGLNCICGFSESFNAAYWCRICSANNKLCKSSVEENRMLVRTISSYEESLRMKDSIRTSIKEKCVFNKINGFHIAQNMSVDFMHDVPEGAAVYTISHILDALIKDKTITLDIINYRINIFSYSEHEKTNKPRPLFMGMSKKGGLKLKIKKSEVLYLQELIKKHNELYLALFGKLKPKMHLLLHYPRVILLIGPVIHTSSVRAKKPKSYGIK